MDDLIDIEDRSSWPVDIAASVERTAKRLTTNREYGCDLGVGFDEEDELLSNLNGRLVRAFHFTRLLGHEVDHIRNIGLIPLSAELLQWRVDAALEHRAISAAQHAALQTANVFHERDSTVPVRAGHVSTVLNRSAVQHTGGVRPLLGTWGGEGIYMSRAGYELRPILKALGRPSIVVVCLDLTGPRRTHHIHPGFLAALVGNSLSLEHGGCEVHYRRPVPADHIVDVWQPGHHEYDAHPLLPRA